MADMGCAVQVSTTPPPFPDIYDEAIQCPHRTTLFYRPTPGQILEWQVRNIP